VVVVGNKQTVVIGGLLGENDDITENKVPFLGDIPVLGWIFKSRGKNKRKTNLLVFLTPNIVRNDDELVGQTIRKREEFRNRAGSTVALSEQEKKEAEKLGVDPSHYRGDRSVRALLLDHTDRYPVERMIEIEQEQAERVKRREAEAASKRLGPSYNIRAEVFSDADEASHTLTELVDAGFDGELLSYEVDGEVLFEVSVGPYETLELAQQDAETFRETYGLTAEITVTAPPEEPETGSGSEKPNGAKPSAEGAVPEETP
jgi:hypothetical protein